MRPAILVVDDDPLLGEVLVEQLAMLGCEACHVSGPDEATPALRRRDLALVLCDLHMQPRDGFDLLAQVRRERPDLPVVLMSAFPPPGTAERSKASGAAGFLAKPFDAEVLQELLADLAVGS